MKPWIALIGSLALVGCGARSGLDVPDAAALPIGTPEYCTGDTPTPIFVVSDVAQLWSFDPPSATFTPVTVLDCPSTAGPETMAVDHENTAYITYDDGAMFAVNTTTTACTQTPFSDGSNDGRFGSCFSAAPGGETETFFLFDSSVTPNGGLVTVDTQTFATTTVGMASENIGSAELTGTGDGRLFAFGSGSMSNGNQGVLAQLDPSDAAVLSQMPIQLEVPQGFAFAFWGGAFYFFTGTNSGDSTVARLGADGTFNPSYATLPGQNLVGAGVSTCAPVD